ncbi:MAG: hypothetical protein ACOX4F_00345 [Atopobiaceae bacterium]|jgi:hypothetical protein
MPKKLTTFSMRMPEDINEKIQAYAEEHQCTKAEAMSHFARAGIEVEGAGRPLSTDDIAKIEAQIESMSTQGSTQNAGILLAPADIKDTVIAYAQEHECSEAEALTYYARLGIQMSADQRPASVAEVAELAKKLDILAQDGQAKTLQMKQMSEALEKIQEYTKPEEIELEGELADPELEAAREAEEKQHEADERTRQIVSDVIGSYLSQQKEEPEKPAINPWVPAVIVLAACLITIIVIQLLH